MAKKLQVHGNLASSVNLGNLSDLVTKNKASIVVAINEVAQTIPEWAKSESAPVTQVNGKTGDVTLDAADVGADIIGSAEKALSNAKSYTNEINATTNARIDNINSEIDAINSELNAIDNELDVKFNAVSSNYDESIIGLSIDGQIITYIKGDGSQHTIVTQDTDTTYTIGTDTTTGLTKLYAVIGSAEDGTMTQKAIKTELDKKVGVAIDDTNDMLIFTV